VGTADAGDRCIDDRPLVERILAHLGLPTARPAISPARSPPRSGFVDESGDFDCVATDDFNVN
jgi:hypothetical protein